ncbi:hypothetical protein [Afipia sp. DC4300-2b1]|uniref:hypothetical protein n=1 Tax=Afipia sp. DC4300-2b1 TaxID=2804672 RepID=UPI003CEA304B
MIALLIGGTVILCIGLLTVVFGIPIKEFSFGNTMILAGAVVSCTGLVLIGLYFVGREFRNLARRLETGLPVPAVLPREQAAEIEASAPPIRPARTLPEPPLTPRPMPPRPAREDTLFTRDQPRDGAQDRDDFGDDSRDDHGRAPLGAHEPAPWPEHPVTRARNPAPATESFEPPAETPARQRRNIMFSSHRRDKARELPPRDLSPQDDSADRPAAEDFERHEPEPEARGAFDSAWPSSRLESDKGRQDSPLTRNERSAPPPASDHDAPEPVRERFQPPRRADASSVTIVKSGVVDSMAYSLYSDGSIEAQMPEGMVRFASIDELRAHLDQRG